MYLEKKKKKKGKRHIGFGLLASARGFAQAPCFSPAARAPLAWQGHPMQSLPSHQCAPAFWQLPAASGVWCHQLHACRSTRPSASSSSPSDCCRWLGVLWVLPVPPHPTTGFPVPSKCVRSRCLGGKHAGASPGMRVLRAPERPINK